MIKLARTAWRRVPGRARGRGRRCGAHLGASALHAESDSITLTPLFPNHGGEKRDAMPKYVLPRLQQLFVVAACVASLLDCGRDSPDTRRAVSSLEPQPRKPASETTVEKLVESIMHGTADERRAATAILATYKEEPKAVRALIGALKDRDRQVRVTAAVALGQMQSVEAIPGVIEALKDPDRFMRATAVHSLGLIGQASAVSGIVQALKDPDTTTRAAAVRSLGLIGDASAVPALAEILKDENGEIRGFAAEALGMIASTSAVRPLIETLSDTNWHVRCDAASALGLIKDKTAVPALVDALKDKSEGVQEAAAVSLGRIGDDQALPALRKLGGNAQMKDIAAFAIRAIPPGEVDQRVADLLRRLRVQSLTGQLSTVRSPTLVERIHYWKTGIDEDDVQTGRFVIDLVAIGKSAVPALILALWDHNADVRGVAASAIGYIHDQSSVPALLYALQDPQRDVSDALRRRVVRALGQIKDARAAPALIEILLSKPDLDVKAMVFLALENISDHASVPKVIRMLEASDLRIPAASLLGHIGDKRAVQPLIELAEDRERVLGDAKGRQLGVEPLIELTKPRQVQLTAVTALGNIGDPRALPVLISLLKTTAKNNESIYLNGRRVEAHNLSLSSRSGSMFHDEELLKLTALALGKIGDPRALPPLREAVATCPFGAFHVAARQAMDLIESKWPNQAVGAGRNSATDGVPTERDTTFRGVVQGTSPYAEKLSKKGLRYVTAGETVYDKRTKLTWQRTVSWSLMYTWVDARMYCAEVGTSLIGTGWRLPTADELKTIVDTTQGKPSIDSTAFPLTPPDRFWSSSPVDRSPSNAWVLFFDSGQVYSFNRAATSYVRCVRGPEPSREDRVEFEEWATAFRRSYAAEFPREPILTPTQEAAAFAAYSLPGGWRTVQPGDEKRLTKRAAGHDDALVRNYTDLVVGDQIETQDHEGNRITATLNRSYTGKLMVTTCNMGDIKAKAVLMRDVGISRRVIVMAIERGHLGAEDIVQGDAVNPQPLR